MIRGRDACPYNGITDFFGAKKNHMALLSNSILRSQLLKASLTGSLRFFKKRDLGRMQPLVVADKRFHIA